MEFYIGFFIISGLIVSVGLIILCFDLYKFKNTGLIPEKEPVVIFFENILHEQKELSSKIEKLEQENKMLEEKINSKVSESLQQAIRDFSVE